MTNENKQDIVSQIIKLRSKGTKLAEIAKQFGITPTMVLEHIRSYNR